MDQKSHAKLQRLIIELDDTRNLYSAMGRMLITPRSKYVVERIVLAHCAIAEDLVEHALLTGAPRVRRGSALGKFYAQCGAWWTTVGANVELSCLLQIERREAWIVQRFCAAAGHAPGLQQRLHRHLHELEYVSAQLACTLEEMDARSHHVPLLAASAEYDQPPFESSNVPSQQLVNKLWQRREPGEATDRPARLCGAESANAVREVTNTRPRMNRHTPPSETPISSRDDHAVSGIYLVGRIRPFPEALDPAITPIDMHRPTSPFKPAHQSVDLKAGSVRPWSHPGRFHEHLRRPGPLRVADALATFAPTRANRSVSDGKHAITAAQSMEGVSQIGSADLQPDGREHHYPSHLVTRETTLGTKARFEKPT